MKQAFQSKIFTGLFIGLFAIYVTINTHSQNAFASDSNIKLKTRDWKFDNMLGTVDKISAQRGFKVYREVCSSCHGLNRIAFRTLSDIGFSENEIKTIAAEYEILDGPNDEGEFFKRPGLASDSFPLPYATTRIANEKIARSVNNGSYPPDLSLIVKARVGGADYIYSLLTGYQKMPDGMKMRENMYYNKYFPDHQIAMMPPLSDDLISYDDDTKATTEQMAYDVVNFLQWTAEPEMSERKNLGIKAMIFLLVMTGFFYATMKRIWKQIK